MIELASEAILREIEAMAGALDILDAQARATGDYADAELTAQVQAKRMRTLFELEVANVLSPDAPRARLVELRLPRLVGYRDAAVALATYFTHPGRDRLVKVPPPKRVLDSLVSLDWFRMPTSYTPPGVDPLDWLALCEHNLRATAPVGTGRLFAKLEGSFHQLWFRTETDATPRLYRVLPA